MMPLTDQVLITAPNGGSALLFCRDAYATLAGIGRQDNLCTDPPYVMRTDGGGKYRAARKHLDKIAQEGLDQGFDLSILDPLQFPHVAVFCHNDQLHDVLPRLAGCYHRYALCTWHKLNAQPLANKHFRPDAEVWLHAWLPDHEPQGDIHAKSRVWTGAAPRGDDRHDHPTPKPLELMQKIVANLPPGSVVDPFMGTGTTGVAAIMAGRAFIGIEHNPKHFNTAVTRIQQVAATMEQAA